MISERPRAPGLFTVSAPIGVAAKSALLGELKFAAAEVAELIIAPPGSEPVKKPAEEKKDAEDLRNVGIPYDYRNCFEKPDAQIEEYDEDECDEEEKEEEEEEEWEDWKRDMYQDDLDFLEEEEEDDLL